MFDEYGNLIGEEGNDNTGGDTGTDFQDGTVDDGLGGWTDNGDGSFTNAAGEIYDYEGNFVGWENEDGTWVDAFGYVYDADGNLIGDAIAFENSMTYEPVLGLYIDKITGQIFNPDGSSYTGEIAVPGSDTGGGFWDGVGKFFSKIFGGSGSGGGLGGGNFGGMSSGGAAQQRAEQSAQKLQQAQQSGASAQQLAQLQQQLTIARAAAASAASSSSSSPYLIGAAVLVGALILTRRQR